MFIRFNLHISFLIEFLLFLDFAGDLDGNLLLLEDVFLNQVDCYLDPLGVDVAVLDRFMSLKQVLDFNDHRLHHRDSKLNRGLKLSDQCFQLVPQSSRLLAVSLCQQLRLNLAPLLLQLKYPDILLTNLL